MKYLLLAAVAVTCFKVTASENSMAPYQGMYKVESCTQGKKAKPCEAIEMRIYLVENQEVIMLPRYVWGTREVAMKKDPTNDFKYTNYHSTVTFTPKVDGRLSLKIDDYIPSSYELVKEW